MENLGWSFSENLQPSEAPVHDTRTNEERQAARAAVRSRWILVTILAVVLLGVACEIIPFNGALAVKLLVIMFFVILGLSAGALAHLFPRQRLKVSIALIVTGVIAFLPIPLNSTTRMRELAGVVGEDPLFITALIGLVLAFLGLFILAIDSKKRSVGE